MSWGRIPLPLPMICSSGNRTRSSRRVSSLAFSANLSRHRLAPHVLSLRGQVKLHTAKMSRLFEFADESGDGRLVTRLPSAALPNLINEYLQSLSLVPLDAKHLSLKIPPETLI